MKLLGDLKRVERIPRIEEGGEDEGWRTVVGRWSDGGRKVVQ